MTNIKASLGLLGAASVLAISTAAHAQVDEIIVTAQKRAQNVQDVGIAITAFGAEQLEALNIDSADDIADSVSGVQVYNYRGKGQPSFVVRGVGTQDFAPNTSPTAAVYVDEVYLGSNIVTGFQIFDVERAEVLKGPQGTLFGRNTTGGAVSYTTKGPTEESEGYIEVGYGNFETFEGAFGIGGELVEGFRTRLAGTFTDQGEGHFKNRYTPDQNAFALTPNFQNFDDRIGEDQAWALRLLTEFDIGNDAVMLFNVHGGERKGDTLPVDPIGFSQIPGASGACEATGLGGAVSDPRFCGDAFGYSDTDGEPFTVSNDFVGENDENNFGVSAKLVWDFENFSLTSISAVETANKFFTADSDGSANSVFNIFYDIGFDQYSQELRLTSTSGGKLFWILGGYASNDIITQAFCGDLNPLLGLGVACRNDFRQETDSLAAYGQVEYDLSDKLKVTAGLRLTNEKRDFNSVNTLTGADGVTTIANFGDGPEDQAVIDDDVSNTKLSGRFALDYNISDDVMVYASYSRGFKSGGYDGDFSFTRQQLDPYSEEILEAYELGWKTTLANGTVRLNGAVFYYDYSNPQIRVQRLSDAGLPFNQLINLDGSEIFGVEADLTWSPTDRFDFQASMSLLDTEIREDSMDPALALFDGNQFALAASESFTLLGRYQHPLTDDLSATVQVDGKYNGPYDLNAENLPWLAQDSYVLANARLSVGSNDKGWEVSVWGKNLANETFSVGSYALFGSFPVYYNTPRTYGATLKYDW